MVGYSYKLQQNGSPFTGNECWFVDEITALTPDYVLVTAVLQYPDCATCNGTLTTSTSTTSTSTSTTTAAPTTTTSTSTTTAAPTTTTSTSTSSTSTTTGGTYNYLITNCAGGSSYTVTANVPLSTAAVYKLYAPSAPFDTNACWQLSNSGMGGTNVTATVSYNNCTDCAGTTTTSTSTSTSTSTTTAEPTTTTSTSTTTMP
jgi:hypothetical protein